MGPPPARAPGPRKEGERCLRIGAQMGRPPDGAASLRIKPVAIQKNGEAVLYFPGYHLSWTEPKRRRAFVTLFDKTWQSDNPEKARKKAEEAVNGMLYGRPLPADLALLPGHMRRVR